MEFLLKFGRTDRVRRIIHFVAFAVLLYMLKSPFKEQGKDNFLPELCICGSRKILERED